MHSYPQSTQFEIPKGEIWTLLGDRAMVFALWLNDATNQNAVAVATIFKSLTDMNINSPVFYQLQAVLLAENVITEVEVANFDARRASLIAPPSFGEPHDEHDGHTH